MPMFTAFSRFWPSKRSTEEAKRTTPALYLNTSGIGSSFHDFRSVEEGAGPSDLGSTNGSVHSLPSFPPAAVIRTRPSAAVMTRAVTLPLPSTSTSPVPSPVGRGMRAHLAMSSTDSLQEQSSSYRHPVYSSTRPLSPIAEQEYLSPISTSISSPPLTASTSYFPGVNPSPATESSSSHTQAQAHLFISRPVKRTLSQRSSRTRLSSHGSTSSWVPPVISPLDLNPPFQPTMDARPQWPRMLSTIDDSGSTIEEGSDRGSLHAESFVTAGAGESIHSSEAADRSLDSLETGNISAIARPRSPPSVSESFIDRRWVRHAVYDTEQSTFKLKRNWQHRTPAFWTFWLGFLFPILWLIGGWHYTHSGENWEFYFNDAGYWKQVLCCGPRRRAECTTTSDDALRIPQWIQDLQHSETNVDQLNDPKRALKNISYGYPFISRAPSSMVAPPKGRVLWILGLPNRILDHIVGVKVKSLRGRRRIIDPWIQRCRYAFCYSMILFWIGCSVAAAVLIVANLHI